MNLVDTIGVDAVAFLQFLSLLRWTFLAVTLISCGILIPLNVIYTLKTSASHNALSMLTISGLQKSKILYVHMGMSYIICEHFLPLSLRARVTLLIRSFPFDSRRGAVLLLVLLEEDARPPKGMVHVGQVPARHLVQIAHGKFDEAMVSAQARLTEGTFCCTQITNIKKEYQSDEGLKELMMKLRGGNEKITSGIQASMIGRDLKVRMGLELISTRCC